MRPTKASDMAALSVRRPPGHFLWTSVFLLLIFIQMSTSLLCFGGVFIRSKEAVISPYQFCPAQQHGYLSCNGWDRSVVTGAESKITINILRQLVILSLYIPVVLVAFALLAMLFAAYARDRAAYWFSMACQAASSLLFMTGIIGFLVLNQSYVSWEHMTTWFYICVGVQVQLVVTTVLTFVSRKKCDWE